MDNFLNVGNHYDKISVSVLGHCINIPSSQLVCLEGDGNYSYLYTSDGKKYLASKTLKSYVSMLDENMFLRIHKSTIVNVNFIEEICTHHSLKLKCGLNKAISRRSARILAPLFATLPLK